jgi:hypothetical protein
MIELPLEEAVKDVIARYKKGNDMPDISRRWLQQQARLAPPGASSEDITKNVDDFRETRREVNKAYRQRLSEKNASRDAFAVKPEQSQESLIGTIDPAPHSARKMPVTDEELDMIRGLNDFDLIMLISEIHDHGWPIARKTLGTIKPSIEGERIAHEKGGARNAES